MNPCSPDSPLDITPRVSTPRRSNVATTQELINTNEPFTQVPTLSSNNQTNYMRFNVEEIKAFKHIKK